MRKKLLTVALAATMAVASVFSAFAEDVDASKKYDGGQKIDGATAWNTADGDNYLISDTPVTVKFTNTPFLRQENGEDKNWFNFVFETVASDSAKGITMRADKFAWTYGDATSEPTYVADSSWGDVWDDFQTMCKANTEVTLTAKKADANTVTFDIAFGSAATEKYTVTYPDGVPSDLRFHVGADGGSIVVNEVVYGSGSEPATQAPATDPTQAPAGTDNPTQAPAGSKDNVTPSKTGDTAAVAVVAIVALGAAVAVVASKKKVTE